MLSGRGDITITRFFNAPHKKFFWGASSFLFGIFIASAEIGAVIFPFFISAFFIFIVLSFVFPRMGLFFIPLCISFMFFGALYYGFFDIRSARVVIPFEKESQVVGIVSDDPVLRNGFQEVRVVLSSPHKGTVLLKKRLFPEFRYGDKIRMHGVIHTVQDDGYGTFLKKEGIRGTISFPETAILSRNNGSPVKAALIKIKEFGFRGIESTLSYDTGSFLKGILFGDTSSFSEDFKEAMKTSGTTHIVALSGYNITILAGALLAVFLLFLSPRVSFIIATSSIFGFVIMTGASPSAVRAGIMGALLLFGKWFGGGRDLKNIILFTALCMVLINPYVLLFDVGFQLSFLAFLGLVYITPVFAAFFPGKHPSILSLRENLFATLSAQLMVLPILLSQFGAVSIISIPANLAILEFIPFTMTFGFFTMFLGIISPIAAFLPGALLEYLLRYEMETVHFFGSVGGTASFEFSYAAIIAYYICMGAILFLLPRIFPKHHA